MIKLILKDNEVTEQDGLTKKTYSINALKGRLDSWRLNKLQTNKELTIRKNTNVYNAFSKGITSKTIEKVKTQYKLDFDKRRMQYEVWRKNPKGYYNCIAYINSESELPNLIEQDQIYLKTLKKPKTVEGDDI